MDLKCKELANGGYYFPEHLPVLGEYSSPWVELSVDTLPVQNSFEMRHFTKQLDFFLTVFVSTFAIK